MGRTQVVDRCISSILGQWQGFVDQASGLRSNSLWDIFADEENNRHITDFILSKCNKKYNKLRHKMLYASVCLLAPEYTPEEPFEKYKFILANGFGVISFKNRPDFFGWKNLLVPEKAQEHFNTRLSIFRLCNDFRLVDDDAACRKNGRSCGDECSPVICLNNSSCSLSIKDLCDTHKSCSVIYEKVHLILDKSTNKFIYPPEFDMLINKYAVEKIEEYNKFKEYVSWMHTNTGPCYYIRKPLVKAAEQYNMGEIYVAIENDKSDESGTNNYNDQIIEDFAVEIIRIIRDYIGVPLLVRQMKLEHERTKKQKEELDKSKQMLNLLLSPLESLTSAAQKLQEDSQTLRSILYDPHRAVFSAAPNIKAYFEPHRRVQIGNIIWDVKHNQNYDHVYIYVAALGGILKEIFGAEFVPKDSIDLLFHMRRLLFDKKGQDPHEQLKKLCITIINMTQEEFDEIISVLSNNEYATIAHCKLSAKLQNSLHYFKSILHTPYKQGGKMPILPLVLVLTDINWEAGNKVDLFLTKNGKEIPPISRFEDYVSRVNADPEDLNLIFSQVKLPVPSYSMLLAFFDGIMVFFNTNIKNTARVEVLKTMIIDDGNSISIDVVLNKSVFKTQTYKGKKIPALFSKVDFLSKIDNAIKMDVRFVAGDAYKPFMDLIGNCKSSDEKPKALRSRDSVTIQFRDSMIVIGDKISFQVKCR